MILKLYQKFHHYAGLNDTTGPIALGIKIGNMQQDFWWEITIICLYFDYCFDFCLSYDSDNLSIKEGNMNSVLKLLVNSLAPERF